MGFNCDVPIFFGPLFVVMGSLALVTGALAWDVPLPARFVSFFTSIVDTEAAVPDSRKRNVWKILGPLNGSIFVLVGLYVIWGTLHCRHINLGIPNIGGQVAFTWWPGIYPAIVVAVGIGIYNSRQYRSVFSKIAVIVGSFGFGLAGGEAAGFHVGVHAGQWGAIAAACWLLIGLSYFIDRRFVARLANDIAAS